MRKRILTAAILTPVLLAILLAAPKLVTAIVVSLLCAVSAYELLFNCKLVQHPRLVIYSMVAAALIPFCSFYGMNMAWLMAEILLFSVLLFMEVMLSDLKLPFEKVAICFVGGLLFPFMLSSIVRILAMEIGRHVILIPFVIGFLSDSGAYFIGCRFGKTKLAPLISPKKSVEGVIGGLVTAVLGMVIYCLVMQLGFSCKVNYFYGILYALVRSFLGVFGDLCFSSVKRQAEIKDFGYLFPGHGGVLDRFDSVIFVAPMIEILLSVIPAVVK